jgi:hypothetical protein
MLYVYRGMSSGQVHLEQSPYCQIHKTILVSRELCRLWRQTSDLSAIWISLEVLQGGVSPMPPLTLSIPGRDASCLRSWLKVTLSLVAEGWIFVELLVSGKASLEHFCHLSWRSGCSGSPLASERQSTIRQHRVAQRSVLNKHQARALLAVVVCMYLFSVQRVSHQVAHWTE